MPSATSATYPLVLVCGEQSAGRVGVVENVMPAGAAGSPLHRHEFDEAFYVLEGELLFRLGDELVTVGAGGVAFAPGGVPHTFANRGTERARFLVVCTPAGIERQFARRAARRAGVEPPEWALQELPRVERVGTSIA